MGFVSAAADAVVALFSLTMAVAAPLFDSQVVLPRRLYPAPLVDIHRWFVAEFGHYLVADPPPFYRGLVWLDLAFLWPVCVANLYGVLARRRWAAATSIMAGTYMSCFSSQSTRRVQSILVCIDDLSHYMWVMVLDSKGEAVDAIKRTQAAAEAKCGHKLRVLRIDNGGEFTAAEFASYCADEGTHRHYSALYSPQQNGVVERRNQTVVGMARALLKQRGMPTLFWGEAVVTAVYILNRSPTKAPDGRTPYEAWHGRKLSVSHLRLFGCLAFAKELGHIGKLDDRSTPGVFIDYTEGSKAYRILDPETQRVHTVRDVVFDEGRGWTWDKTVDNGSTLTYDDFTVEYIHFKEAGGVGSSHSPSVPIPVSESPPTSAPATSAAPRSRATTSAAPSSSPTPPQPATPRTCANSHPSGHVRTNTSSREAQPGAVRYSALT